MDKPKHKKPIPARKIEEYLKQQEQVEEQKHFNPGKVEFVNSDFAKCRVVNFFGDVHTESFTLKVNHDDKVVAVGCSNGQVKLYDIYEGKVLNIGNTSRKSNFPCTGLRWKPKTKSDFVTGNCDGTVKWYNQKQESAYEHYEMQGTALLCCDYQNLQEWCVFGTDKNSLELFDNYKMKPFMTYHAGGPEELTNNRHTNRIFSVKCLKEDSHLLFSGGWDSTVHIWDVRVKDNSVRKICGPFVSADSLDFKDGILLSGNYQNNDIVQLYDFKSGKVIEALDIKEAPNGNSYCFAASFAHRSEYSLIAVGLSGCNKVKLFKDRHLVGEMKFQAAPLSLDFYRFNGKDFLIVGGVQGTIYAIKIKIL